MEEELISDYNENEGRQWNGVKKQYKDHTKPQDGWQAPETMNDVKRLDACDWTDRGLTKATLDHFGVKCAVNQEMGPGKIDKVFFPYRDQKGKLVGYKVKDLTKDKSEKRHFYSIGTVGVGCQLFGQHLGRQKSKYVISCEGEVDCLSVYQATYDNTEKKYRPFIPPITSIGCGTVHALDHMINNTKYIESFEELRLCYDNDELSAVDMEKSNPGMKGKEATRDVANHFMKLEIKIARFPEWMNDCSDYLQAGKSNDLYQKVIWNCEEYQTEEIVSLYDKFKEGELFSGMTQGIFLNAFPKLMDKMLGIRDGELTLIMAPSGVGKSSITADIAYAYAKEGNGGVGGIFLEEGMKKTCNRFIARDLEIHPNKYKWNPGDHCTYDQYLKSEKWVGDEKNFLFLDHFGIIKIKDLLAFSEILIFKHHRRFIVLDHISLTVSGNGDIDERVELEEAMMGLASLCERSGAHIMVVSHINRLASSTAGKDRDITEPKWKRTFITDGKGTQALEALSWNIICIDVEILPDGTRGRIRLFLGKNREADELGFCDVVRMHPDTGVFYDASAEVWHKETTGYGGDE